MTIEVNNGTEIKLTFNSFTDKSWITLWNSLKQKPELVKSNNTIKQAVINYENVFFSNIGNMLCDEISFHNLEIFYILHKRKCHILTLDKFRFVITNMVNMLKEDDLYKAYRLAVTCPESDLCQTVVKDFERKNPKKVAQSQNKIIQVIENQNLNAIDGRRSLFKSAQEKEFFDAVRDVYPQFIVYPNVAMSSVFEFECIKNLLSDAEKKYFFMAVIDCVVFDYQQLYLPKYFFEIDSIYHDGTAQIIKDEYKNNIFSAAGQKLYRIRRTGKSLGRIDFTRLIRELLQNAN